MKTREYCVYLKKLNKSELLSELEKVERELFSAKLNVHVGQKNYANMTTLKRNVARIKTFLHTHI